MDYKIVWSDAAISDLEEIYSWIATENSEIALEVARAILKHVNILASFPSIGPTYPRGTNGPIRQIVFQSYRIFYDLNERLFSVEILHIWHSARHEPDFRPAH